MKLLNALSIMLMGIGIICLFLAAGMCDSFVEYPIQEVAKLIGCAFLFVIPGVGIHIFINEV